MSAILRATDEQRLLLCDVDAQPLFRAALPDLKAMLAADGSEGGEAYFERAPARGAKDQQEKVRLKLSRIEKSLHCHAVGGDPAHPHEWTLTVPSEVPDEPCMCECGARARSRAIHIIGTRSGAGGLYDLPPAFQLKAGAAALRHGLGWGGLFGPTDHDRDHRAYFEQIRTMLRGALWDGRWDEARHLWSKRTAVGGWGWDPNHWEYKPGLQGGTT